MTDSIQAAREVLPWFMPYAPTLAACGLAVLVPLLSATLAQRVGLALPQDFHSLSWVERARLLHPARAAMKWQSLLFPVTFIAFSWHPSPLSYVPAPYLGLVSAALALVSIDHAGQRIARLLSGRAVPSSALLRWRVGQLIVVASPLLVVLVFALSVPADSRVVGLVIAAPLAFAGALGAGIIPARILGLVRPAGARLQAVIERAAARSGVRPRASYEVPWPGATAFALPHVRSLGFSARVVDELSDDELEAIARHELGHLDEPWAGKILRVATPLTAVGCGFAWAVFARDNPDALNAIAVVLVVVLLASHRLGRRMEEHADRHAVATGDARVYAGALEHVYRINLTPAVMFGGQLHPHLFDRMTAAGTPPAYARPLPPSRARTASAIGIGLAVVLALSYAPQFRPTSEPGMLLRIALYGDSIGLSDLALLRFRQGKVSDALALYGACAVGDSADVYCRANLAITQAATRRCPDALRSAQLAGERVTRGDAGEEHVAEHALFAARRCISRE